MVYGLWYKGSIHTEPNIGSADTCLDTCYEHDQCKYWSWDSVAEDCYLYQNIDENNLEHRLLHSELTFISTNI